jgi:two-component system nitrogen regulation response regulator GlnG
MSKVLVIDDDRIVIHLVQRSLQSLDVEVVVAQTAEEGLKLVTSDLDVVLLDIVLPGVSGMDVFRKIQTIDRRLPVIFMTAAAGSDTAIEAMRLGAYDYLAKPLDLTKLNKIVNSAIETRRLMRIPVAVATKADDRQSGTTDLFIGKSPQTLEVFKSIGQVAGQNITVLIRGESGTGKELVARALYQFSERATRPFMAINCAALSETLLESELFGHEKGSFTSADKRRIGKFEQCNGGTLFLDEVGDMPSLVQAKVLRLLQEQKFERLGGNETIETNVRLIAATNRPLEKMVDNSEFREDLFYRLNVVTISLPALRDRADDIPLLLEYMLSKACRELSKPLIEGISPEALSILMHYPWPGNIRELQSVVRQFVIRATGPVIVPDFLPENIRSYHKHGDPAVLAHMKPTVSQPQTEAYDSAIESSSQSHIASGTSISTHDGIPLDGAAHSLHEHGKSATDVVHSHQNHELAEINLQHYIEQRLGQGTTNLYAEMLEHMERYLITRILRETEGNQSKAAEILGITRGKIRDRIAAFQISLEKIVSINPPNR